MADYRYLLTRTVDPLLASRCLGLSQKGAPRHPLFVKADQPLVPFEVTRG